MKKIDPVLNERLTKLIGAMGYELVGCEWLPMGGRTIFRLFIDGPKGVTIDDCSRVSQQVGAMLDVEGPLKDRYNLEVSSPGIDRPLFEIKHFQQFIGHRVKIRLSAAIDKRKQYQGVLQQVDGENIHLFVDEMKKEIVLPYSSIEKANLIGDIRI